MVQYKRINVTEREEISRQIASGSSIRAIARSLGRSPSTICREINRNVVDRKYYRGFLAQGRWNAKRRKLRKNRKLATNPRLRRIVLGYLRQKWSPEQIAKRLIHLYPKEPNMHVSHETIYSYIYILPRGELKREIASCLRRRHKGRHKKHKHRRDTAPLKDYLSIEERPKEVADRIIPGHWEGDIMIGANLQSAIGTLVERTTRMTFIVKLKSRDAMTVRKAFAEEFRHLPKGLKRTLTYDQGREMAQHKLFNKETDMTVYFAHPHSPWERGTNENTNALIRQYFPKGTDFSKITRNRLKKVQDELNDRPRKVLGWYTPHETFGKVLR